MPLETKDWVTIGVAGTSLIVTIVWNLYNSYNINRIARGVRSEIFALDEWRTKRAEVMRALRLLEEQLSDLVLLVRAGDGVKSLKNKISDIGRDATRCHGALMRELDRAKENWSSYAYGRTVQGETDWDMIHSILYEIGISNNVGFIRQKLQEIEPHARQISKVIESELQAATTEHDPVKF